jgi:hypothetical protein
MQNLTPSGVSTSQPGQRIDGLSGMVVRVAGAWMGKSGHTRLASTGLRCGVLVMIGADQAVLPALR